MTVLLFGALGAVVGSFVGVVAERMHTGQSFLHGRSRCNSCARTLGPADLVPVFSWLASKGRCRSCGSRVPWSYVVLEVALGAAFAYAAFSMPFSLPFVLFLASLAVTAFIVVYDLRHTIVPPRASALLFVLSLACAVLVAPNATELGGTLLTSGLIGGAFLALHVLSKGRAMGLGDAPVALSLSLLVAPFALSGLLFSFWTGALYGIFVLATRRGGPRMGIELPFVPFLALGFALALLIRWNPLAYLLF